MPSSITQCVLKLMGHFITQFPETSMLVIILPTFAYKSGMLYNEEFALLKVLANAGCHVDGVFTLLFDPKSKTEIHCN